METGNVVYEKNTKVFFENGYNMAIEDVRKVISKKLSGDTHHLTGKAYIIECAYLDIMNDIQKLKVN